MLKNEFKIIPVLTAITILARIGNATVQLNLNLTKHTCGMYSTRHVFHFARMQACKINDVETLVQSTRVCTRHAAETRVHVRYIHAKSGLRAPWRVYEL